MLDTNVDLKRKCIGITKDGNKCNAYALSDSDYCLFHAPELEELRKENGVFGGRTRKYLYVKGEKTEIKDVESVISLIEEVIGNLKKMDLTVGQAKALLAACDLSLKALEYRELTSRVEALESSLKEK